VNGIVLLVAEQQTDILFDTIGSSAVGERIEGANALNREDDVASANAPE